MIIDPNNRLATGNSQSSRSKPSAGVNGAGDNQRKASAESATSTQDSVKLSPEAQALKRLEAQISASPDIDSTRVAAIKRAIAEGNFEINVERIAERMLQQDSFFE